MTSWKLIVNADDFGYSVERDEGIIECLHPRGLLRSTSVLVNGASAHMCSKLLAGADLSVGLHVNVTEGAPISRVSDVPSLLKGGYFKGKMSFRAACSAGEIDLLQLETEVRAQVTRFTDLYGRSPSHFDGHQHIQTLPGVADVLAKVMHDFDICATRIPRGHAVEKLDALPPSRASFYAEVSGQCELAAMVFASQGVLAPQFFLGYTTMGQDCSVDRILSLVAALKEHHGAAAAAERGGARPVVEGDTVFIEWMVHPGNATRPRPLSEEDVEAGCTGDAGCGEGPDGFSKAPGRRVEADVLLDPRLAQGLRELGVTLASYDDFVADVASRASCKAAS